MSTTEDDAGVPTIEPAATADACPMSMMFNKEPAIVDYVLSNLTPGDIASLTVTGSYMHEHVRAYQDRTFKIERVLSRFIGDNGEFRRMQARTGTVISGSVALEFFNRTLYAEADLDLYVEHRYALELVRFLCVHEEYIFLPTDIQEERIPHNVTPQAVLEFRLRGVDFDYGCTGISEVLNFGKGARRVQVIVVKRAPLEVILTFHSTCVMNVITHNAAYCLFPRLTLDKHVSRLLPLSPSVTRPRWSIIRDKYLARGFTFAPSVPGDFMRPIWDRWVGDSHTWVVPFAPTVPDLQSPDTVTLNAFRTWYDPAVGHSTIIFDIFRHNSLSFTYTCIKEERAMLRLAYENQQTARLLTYGHGATYYSLDTPITTVMYGYRTAGVNRDSFADALTPGGSSRILVFPPGGHRTYRI